MSSPSDSILDIARARRETLGTRQVAHFNNAGSALMPDCVLRAQMDHLELEAAIGGYEAADREQAAINNAYDAVARLINCKPAEIAVVENATVGWDMGFYAIPLQKGDRILTAEAEYGANFVAYLQQVKRTGAVVEVIPSTGSGEICLESLEKMIDERVKLISITHIPTNGGLINPAVEVGRIAKKHNILYMLDACQSVGQIPVDVQEIQCDMLSATARKFIRGPRGVGFLYVRESLIRDLEPPLIDHASARWVAPDRYELLPDAKRFENWENNYAAKIGMGVAADYALEWGMENIDVRNRVLASDLRHGLGDIGKVTLQDIGRDQCAIVSFSVEDQEPFALKQALGEQKINISVSNPHSTLLDSTRRNLPPILRASVHYYNDHEEIERLVRAVHALA